MHRVSIIRAGGGSACPRRCTVSSELRGIVAAGDGRCPPTQDGSSWHGERLEWGRERPSRRHQALGFIHSHVRLHKVQASEFVASLEAFLSGSAGHGRGRGRRDDG